MNLKKNIKKILKEEENLVRVRLLTKYLDDFFDNFKLIKTEPDLCQFNWYDEKGDKILERNNWGMLWIYNCNFFYNLKLFIINYLSFSYHEFNDILINYLNGKYGNKFQGNLLKDIGTGSCDEYGYINN